MKTWKHRIKHLHDINEVPYVSNLILPVPQATPTKGSFWLGCRPTFMSEMLTLSCDVWMMNMDVCSYRIHLYWIKKRLGTSLEPALTNHSGRGCGVETKPTGPLGAFLPQIFSWFLRVMSEPVGLDWPLPLRCPSHPSPHHPPHPHSEEEGSPWSSGPRAPRRCPRRCLETCLPSG